MNTKLTLRLDESLIETAKSYAQTHKTSLSRMIATYFRSLKSPKKEPTITPLVEELSGILPTTLNTKASIKQYKNYLAKKYK